MKRKLLAVLITLILVISSIVPVVAGGTGGNADPPIAPRPMSIEIPFINFCDCYDDAYCDICNLD